MGFRLTKLLFLIVLFVARDVSSQKLLAKQDAINQMLNNNFGIQLANNLVEIADNNQGILNSGYLPSVTGNAGAQYDETTSETEFTTPGEDGTIRPEVIIPDAETQSYNASINVDYLLFDGLGRYYNYKQLKEQYNLSELQTRETIENTILQLFSVYYNVARLSENISVLEQAVEISVKRVTRSKYQFDYGQNTKLEVLQAEVDVVTDSVNLLNARQQLENAKRDLNVVLNRELEEKFTVDTLIVFQNRILLETFIQEAAKNNVTLLQAESQIQISEYNIKAAKSLLLPTIGLTGSYGWNRNNNPSSAFFPATIQRNQSLRLGANLTWNLFDGGTSITNLKNAKILKNSDEIQRNQLKLQVNRDIANAMGNYKNALKIFKIREQNVLTNKNNLERSEERLKLGQITSIEFRQAQINLIDAETNKNLAKYDAKLAELEVLRLTGQLLNIEF
ncbi:MAG: TolC family protein [Bacteroidota bacterium]